MATSIIIALAIALIVYGVYELLPEGRPRAASTVTLPLDGHGAQAALAPRVQPLLARLPALDRWITARVDRKAQTWLVVALLVACAAVQWWLNGHPDALPVSFALLVIGGIAAAALLHLLTRRPADAFNRAGRTAASALPVSVTLACGAIGIACAVVGAATVQNGWTAQVWWFAAMGIPLLALLAGRLLAWHASGWPLPAGSFHGRGEALTPQPPLPDAGEGEQRPQSSPLPGEGEGPGVRGEQPRLFGGDALIMVLLFLGAMVPRVIDLTASPPFLHGDEASCGLYGRIFISGQQPLLSISWYGLPMFSYAVSGVGLRLFGDSVFGLRFTNVLIGSASIPLLYAFGRELFDRRAALLGAIVLGLTFLDIDLSRDGIHYIQGPTCITLTLFLLIRALRRGGLVSAFLAGICTIVCLQVYWSARITPILVAGLLALLFLTARKDLLARWRELLWYGLGLAACGLPVAALFLANPGSFAGHQNEVSIFDTGQYMHDWLMGAYGTTDPLTVLLRQTWLIATTFNAHGDSSLQIGWGGAMLDTASAALLPAALFLALARWRRWPYLLLLVWFGLVAGAGIITGFAPWWPRLSALLPAIALLIGVLLSEAWTALRERLRLPTRGLALAAAAVLACIAIGNLRVLAWEYPAQASQSDRMEATYIGRFLAHAPGAAHTVLLSDGSMYVDYEPVRFLAPHSGGCTLMAGQPLSQCPVAAISRLYVLLPGRIGDLPWLERQHPGGKTINLGTYGYGASRVLAYELPAQPRVANG